jgi:hypothetical protein
MIARQVIGSGAADDAAADDDDAGFGWNHCFSGPF